MTSNNPIEHKIVRELNITRDIHLLDKRVVEISFKCKYFYDPAYTKILNNSSNKNNKNYIFDKSSIGFEIIDTYLHSKENGIIINDENCYLNPIEHLNFIKYIIEKLINNRKMDINATINNKNILFYLIEYTIIDDIENENFLSKYYFNLIEFLIESKVSINFLCEHKDKITNINKYFTVTSLICYLYRGLREHILLNENNNNFNEALYQHYINYLENLLRLLVLKGGDLKINTSIIINNVQFNGELLIGSKFNEIFTVNNQFLSTILDKK